MQCHFGRQEVGKYAVLNTGIRTGIKFDTTRFRYLTLPVIEIL